MFPLPPNETDRLQALRDLGLLDTLAEFAFDEVVPLASYICGTPVALVTLVDENRQWFKSKVGIDITETPRYDSFCAHGIMQDDLFIVPDASADDRFSSNPLVLGAPHIRFYA